jgi:Family of unknown function (DUF6152)
MTRTFVSASLSAIALACVPLVAHHGDSGRYEDKLTTVTGTVSELQLVNPHSILVLDVTDESGKVVKWRGELGSAQGMKRWCWTKDTIKNGDKMTMTGRKLKNGSPYMTLSEGARVYDATGKEIFRGNDPGQPPGGGSPPPCASAQ